MADSLTDASTASIPGVGGQQPVATPDPAVIKALLAQMTGGGGQPNQPLTQTGTQMIQPTMMSAPRVGSPEVPQGSFRTKGEAQRAGKQAMFNNISSIVKTGVDRIHEKQVNDMQKNTERMLGAINGLNEAKASGDQDAIKHNTDLLNMLLDPTTPEGKKRIKSFQKAFSVNLMDDKGKDTPEYKGLVKAYQEYGKEKQAGGNPMNPLVQRLLASMPQRTQINPQLAAQGQLTKDGVIQSADSKATGEREAAKSAVELERDKANNQTYIQAEQMKAATQIRVAQMMGGRDANGGVLVVAPPDVPSITGFAKKITSKDGTKVRYEPDVVVPSTLPSTREGHTMVQTDDGNGNLVYAEVPNVSTTSKSIPGRGNVGAGGVVSPATQQGLDGGKHKATHEAAAAAQKAGLPPGSIIVASKDLSPAQVAAVKEAIGTLDATVTRLKDIKQYTDLYQGMLAGGKVKMQTSKDGRVRIIAGWLPTTDDEAKAAAAWQESSEYMNTVRQSLKGMGFRSLYAWDAMQSLKGQIWQDKRIMNKTIDDTIEFLQNQAKKKAESLPKNTTETDRNKTPDAKDNPAGLVF